MVQHVLVCHRLAEEEPIALSQCYLAANPRLIALYVYVSHLTANDWRTNENMAITPFGPINRAILCCDFFIRQDLQEGVSYFERVLWDTDINKRIVISVELNLH